MEKIQPTQENGRIIANILADHIKQAMRARNPPADELLNSIGNTRVVFK